MLTGWMVGVLLSVSAGAGDAGVLELDSRLELLVDDYLIETIQGQAEFQMHSPIPREVVIVHDAPWEGNSCGYYVVFRDGEIFRMYYRGSSQVLNGEPPTHEMNACYAESRDGIHWTKPSLGLFEFGGSKDNNIIWQGSAAHDFTPFKDSNPNCGAEGRYKTVCAKDGALVAFQSPDGVHWAAMNEGNPVITTGAFDSQNVAFWDDIRGEYRAYIRDFREGLRDIRTATSQDFIHWSDPVWLEYPGAPKEQLYTNQVIPYYRAPHLFVGFPTRYIDRGWGPSMEALPEPEHRHLRSAMSAREGTALTDGLFMTSRDAVNFHRWNEAFIRPGLRTRDNWVYGDNYQGWGIIETPSMLDADVPEMSVYATESYWTGTSSQLRRYTLRVDGFVSIHAPREGGELVTKPLIFSGSELVLNFSTSGAGSIRIEIQDASGSPLEGYRLDESPEIFGDALDRVAPWSGGRDLSALSGKPVRLRIVLNEADLYSLRFRSAGMP